VIWSFVLAGIGITGLFLAGRGQAAGWLIGLGSQLLWVAYALATGQYGFLLSAAGYGSVYALNAHRWLRARRTEETQ